MDSSNFDVHVSSIKILTPWTNGSESFGIRANLELLFKSNLTEKLHFNFDEDDKDCDIYDLCKAAVMGPSLQNTNCLVLCENETYPNGGADIFLDHLPINVCDESSCYDPKTSSVLKWAHSSK